VPETFSTEVNTLNILAELGYKVDPSVSPRIDWNFKESRANLLNAPDQPYYPKENNILAPTGHGVLTIPVSIIEPEKRRKMHSITLHTLTDRLYAPVLPQAPTHRRRP
jgi:hypothetical protein